MPAHRIAPLLLLFFTCCGEASADAVPLTAQAKTLCEAAIERTLHGVRYDPAYVRLDYPGGDVPADRGVCTDVVIRSYRAAFDQDLQALVHEDMARHFESYPKIWGLTRPDSNIDHRRVPNLSTYWERRGCALPVSEEAAGYAAGDLVTWSVAGRPHVGIVVDRRHPRTNRHMIVHNIGAGPRLEDCLFDWPITGHFRWLPESEEQAAGAADAR